MIELFFGITKILYEFNGPLQVLFDYFLDLNYDSPTFNQKNIFVFNK